jgi:excisionase family DNA binding protein
VSLKDSLTAASERQNLPQSTWEVLSLSEVAQQYRLGRDFVRCAVRTGQIPSIPVGSRKRVVPRIAVERWIAAQINSQDSDAPVADPGGVVE